MIVILVIVIFIVAFIYFNTDKNEYFKDKEVIYAYGDILQKQAEMDKKIEGFKQENYTMEKAKVIVNPYELSPLTALIIFNTEKEESISININGKDVTETVTSKNHVIPIYGLQDDYNNIVKLSSGKKTVEYKIKTDKFNGKKIKIEKSRYDKLDDSLYFISPNFTNNVIYDKEGNLVWYILGDYAGDIEYLPNGHFYISDPYQGTNGVKINYSSFLEIDYLGKIYNQYVSDYGYHHELVQLENDKILILGSDDNSNFLESIIYIMDLKTGKVEDSFDMYDILYKIDKNWVKKLDENFDFVVNSAQYFKASDELLISVRGFNSIMMLDMKNKDIKWIFGDNEFYSSAFEKYLLKPIDNTRYTAGQHSAFITEDGLLGIHNNDFDMINNHGIELENYVDNYSSVNLYEINTNKKTIKTVWEYSSKRKEFSKVAGYFDILDNNNKLITYGWSITQDAYKNVDSVTINDEKYLNGVIEEIDENDNVLFRATTPDLIYRTYKIPGLYEKKIDNYEVESYTRISDLKVESKEISTFKIKKKLKSSKKFDGNIETYINRIIVINDFSKEDIVDIYLVSKDNKTYIYNYKEKGKQARNSVRVSQVEGEYAVYIKVNDSMFDTGKIINFN